jgi:predicted nucleic acid-binding protein
MLVVDASVAVKWCVAEVHHEAARALLQEGQLQEGRPLATPGLVLAEFGKTRWRLPGRFTQLAPMRGLHDESLDLAPCRNHLVYDCLYVALALALALALTRGERAPFVTADARLADRFSLEAEVRLLA